MKKITIMESQNGWSVSHGDINMYAEKQLPMVFTYNGLDKAISHIRRRMRDMHPIVKIKEIQK